MYPVGLIKPNLNQAQIGLSAFLQHFESIIFALFEFKTICGDGLG